MEISHIELIENLSEACEGQLVFFIRVTKTKQPFCQDHREVAILCKGYFVYCNCLERLLLDAPRRNIAEQFLQEALDLILDLRDLIC